ncbi:DUF7935 family protein [Flavobacterium frigidarium]|uniref:DUF7935 family protein n=1 Tax=Flavobacterium frigidarium TaxID=99286 RepID=UPI00040C3393|nr:hypothetical protein [Flavobacterium frigidarium]
MNSVLIAQIIAYTIPSIATAAVAYYFFNEQLKEHLEDRKITAVQDDSSLTTIRLQAYERLTLFLERINPSQLMVRIIPISENKFDYQNYVIAQIEQEYEHNLSQQIYMSEECWSIITSSKNKTIQLIRAAIASETVTNADSLREYVLKNSMENVMPSKEALFFLKEEVNKLW